MSQKLSGTYVGLLNGVPRDKKSKARKIRENRGLTAAISFLRKARKVKKSKKK